MTIDSVDREKISPMMRQYIEIKEKNRDTILFYRVGDFYEMFFEDAFLGARVLELQLTGKDAGLDERVPMCGLPFHAYSFYATKLIEKGFKVGIVEQVEDPATAKGLVKRDVVKILTPGTTIDTELDSKENNYIVAILPIKRLYAMVYADVSTGDIYATRIQNISSLKNEIISIHAREIVISEGFNNSVLDELNKNYGIVISKEKDNTIPEHLKYILNNIDDEFYPVIGILLNYLIFTLKNSLTHLKKIEYYDSTDYLRIDPFTKRNLELTETLRSGQKSGSLLWLLDKCQTAMGSRMLKMWIERPLVDINEINKRLDYVEALNNNYLSSEEIKNALKNVYDLERIVGRISVGNANAKDLVQLRRSLESIPDLKRIISKLNTSDVNNMLELIDEHSSLVDLLERALLDEVPLTIKEGQMIREGYNEELDNIKNISKNSKDWVLSYELKEQERTGIKGLKVGYNRVFGYYIEVTKSYLDQVKDEFGYIRKQTLTNAERFITPELKEYENIIVGSEEKIVKIEYELFVQIREIAKKYSESLQVLANAIAQIDVYQSLSEISLSNNYVRPIMHETRDVTIIDGRHPVVEKVLDSEYVANDIIINKYNTLLITGPNMSGKSTYMREFALISIMAQIGSFVPASTAKLCIFDSLFTRIGASDDLISGQSTFMVEMMEANYAIKNATKNSLILFDELGRGTSTFDGMALAQAIIEYIHDRISCVMLFSTHYHELQNLDRKLSRLKNVHVTAKETKDGVVFLHKVLDGGADKSYGINVAKLAGLPRSLIERANNILDSLEEDSIDKNINLDLFNFQEYDELPEVIKDDTLDRIKEFLNQIDINQTTPLEAMQYLLELKKMGE